MTRREPVGLDPDELARLADRGRPALIARARRRHPRIPDADLEDIFSDTVEALLRRGDVTDARHLEGALSIGIEFRAQHWHRRDGRTTPLDEAGLPEPVDSAEDPATITARRDDRALAIELLAELEPDEQRALKLRVGEELSRSGAARAMAIDVAQLRRLERSGWKKLERIATVAQAGRLCDTRALQAEAPADAVVQVAVEAHLRRCSACRRDYARRRAAIARDAAGLLPLPVLLGGAGKGALGGILGALGLDRLLGGGKAAGSSSSQAGAVAAAAAVATAVAAAAALALTAGDDDEDKPRPEPPPTRAGARPAPPLSAAPPAASSRPSRQQRSARRSRSANRSAPAGSLPTAPASPGPASPGPATSPPGTTPPRSPSPRPSPPRSERPDRPDGGTAPPPLPPTGPATTTPVRPASCTRFFVAVQLCRRPGPPIDLKLNPRPTHERPLIDIGIRP